MRTLYHFRYSPFSRRTRLALAHKGLTAELRDARENPAWMVEARALVAFKTIPVLVDGDHALGDSTAIAHWLDRSYPQAPRLWPDDDAHRVFEISALVDVALVTTVDLGTRYSLLQDHPAWKSVRDEMGGRAQRALDALAERASSLPQTTVAKSGWSAADIWLLTAIAWFEGMPARAAASPHIAQILTLGLTLPPALSAWADGHRDRVDVRALG